VARRRASRRAQRGIALLGLLAVAVMVFAYVLTSRLNAASRFVGVDRDNNAQVLSQAKRALIAWMATAAATDNNPGRLPCPQAWGDVGTTNEGRAAGNCSVPAVGWLPWRSLGMDRPVDASGNQIWYVISSGWHLPSAGATLNLNSDSSGQLALDGQAAVALLIAPGPALGIAPNANQIAAGCAARSQSQVLALPGTPPDPLDFLECQNGSTADNVFAASAVDNAVNPVFNDQVLAITAADVMPALEAAIADRMQREIAPAMKNAAFVLDSSSPRRWVSSSSVPTMYPYAAPFANPSLSNFRGSVGTYQGLAPFAASAGFVAYESTPANAVETMGNGTIESQTCSWETANEVRVCEGKYKEDSGDPSLPMRIQMTATFTNVAMGFRTLDATRLQAQARDDSSGPPPWNDLAVSYRAEMNDGGTAGKPRGSVTVRFWANLPNIDTEGWVTTASFRIRIERAIIADHCLLNITTGSACPGGGPDTSWFVRNDWYRLAYYAVSANNTADFLASLGCGDTNCLRFNEGLSCGSGQPWCNIRALLVLGGASISNPAGRPNGNLLDYFEYTNNDGGTFYEQHQIRRPTNVAVSNGPWNDRVILVDWLPPSLLLTSPNNHPQVVADTTISPVRIYYLPLP
jgi:hypothetical protein